MLRELDEAANILPEWIATDRGRVDKAAAYGIMSRAALMGGSFNYNVVNDYADGDEHEKYVAETKNAFQADQVEEGEDDGLLHCGSGALKGCFKQR